MNWPLNTEIDTKGGGKACLYEEKGGYLFGRIRSLDTGEWFESRWNKLGNIDGYSYRDTCLSLLPIKRKIYLAWTEGEPKPAVYLDKDSAEEYSTFYKGLKIRTIQEITEP